MVILVEFFKIYSTLLSFNILVFILFDFPVNNLFNRSICDFNKLHKTETQKIDYITASTDCFSYTKIAKLPPASMDLIRHSRIYSKTQNYTRNPRFVFAFSICLVSGCRVEPKLSCCGETAS